MTPEARLTGLSMTEAAGKLRTCGPNAIPERPPEPVWRRFARQFQSPLIYILLFAVVVDLAVWWREGAGGAPVEAIVIGLILLLNAVLGVWQETKAEESLAKLKTMAARQVWALRDGRLEQVDATTLVPGDAVRIEAGGRVPADGVAHGAGISADESILTGESLPVDKEPGGELFSGTLITTGKGYLEVTRTGAGSALGRLAVMLGEVKIEPTPLERRLHRFGNQVAIWILALAGLLILQGLVTEGIGRIEHVLLFAVALAVAAVPEGLPAVLTLTLALGVERMTRRKAVVRKLSAVEALGSVTVIATDKTGTLTENRMQVRQLDSPARERALRAIVLANDAEAGAGDPMDLALCEYAASNGVDVGQVRASHPRVSERSFDSARKYMRVTVSENGGRASYLKGAPEVMLERSTLGEAERARWVQEAIEHARQGYRVLGVAACEGEADDGLDFLGLALFWDPPRPEVPAAIREAQRAGIRVLMVTGDHPATAMAIARQIGIESGRVITGDEWEAMSEGELGQAVRSVNVFARVKPEQKLQLVEILKKQGEVVAMTGDGVNDAPALKRSDVGVAMGQRGSDVSREVADLVLLDDNFATIVAAVEEGRSIYENIQKFVRFLFSTNLSEVIVVAGGVLIAALLGLREADGSLLLPLVAVQILWINLVTDGLPALSLTMDRNPGVMLNAPRAAAAPLLDGPSRRFVILSGVIKALFALGILALAQVGWMERMEARSATFHFMSIGQLFFAYPARHTHVRPSRNHYLLLAVILGVVLQVAVGSVAFTAAALGSVLISATAWAGVIAAALLAWGLAEALNHVLWAGRGRRSHE
jgi:Ca2+-transporting ATPase